MVFQLPFVTRYVFADQCKKPPSIQNLELTAQLPVSYNVTVTVKCETGYSLVGSEVITCIKDNKYQSVRGQLPFCKQSESALYGLFLRSSCTVFELSFYIR